ncbi:MAG: hypothetical protein CM1200mP41_07130 [Gammaproteobacteria bacterium]|nr:MAG: hypothetical protein CM1200mP41_07130 [Gammaproteobacteria bacterium]
MLIGLGGGAASSVGSGKSSEQLDFASVQRGNPEMQRRCQEVIDRCTGLGPGKPDCVNTRRWCRWPVECCARISRGFGARGGFLFTADSQ